MVGPESCLSWCVQIQVYGCGGQAFVNYRHKQFGKWWCYCNTAVVVRQLRIPFSFV
jgi:hypothetical protein